MSHRREYDIAFVGLKPGVHTFEYGINDQFFVPYGEQDFRNCNAEIVLHLDKKSGFMQLKFEIGGQLELICDRCGNTLQKQLWDEFVMIVKMVDEPELMNEQEEDPDVFYISRGESHLHLADWFYEFINLCIPLQKSCDEPGGEQCNNEVLEQLRRMEEEIKKDQNPIWKGLDQLKNLDS
jgi:uncharacterized metal-binding protein YceD (DUF177 family)